VRRETNDKNLIRKFGDDSNLITISEDPDSLNSPTEGPNKELQIRTKIVVADDQLMNIEILKSHMQDLGLVDSCLFCINGQDTIDTVKSVVDEALAARDHSKHSLMPVQILLLDF